MTTVLLIRHGETGWNRERRIQGWAPVPLSDRGREQAQAVGEHVAERYDVDRLVASDLDRTLETARHIADPLDVEIASDRAWRERHFGVYQGLLYEEVFDRHPELDLTEVGVVGMELTPECGESMLDTYERVLDGWHDLLANAGADETVAVVTHGGPIYCVLSEVKGMDAIEAIAGHSMRNCSVTEVEHDTATGELHLARENAVDYRR